jgi:hypothetical protein
VIDFILFRTKSLICKDALHRESTIQKYFRDSALVTSQKNRFPVSRPTTCHPVRTLICPLFHPTYHTVQVPDRSSIIHPNDVYFRLEPSLYREASVPACIRPDDSAARPDDVEWLISFRFSFQVQIREDWCNRLDDVDSRPDALIHKAKIAIQIHPSRRQSAWSGLAFNKYGNFVFNFNRPDACLSWSGRALIWYGNCVLKINRPDDHPPRSRRAKPYMQITCSGRATVRTTMPHRPDAALKQERFSAKISEILVAQLSVWMAFVHRQDDTRIFQYSPPFEPQPINRGPWALRTARIRYWIPSELRELFFEVIRADLFTLKPLQVCCCCTITEVYLRGRP